MEAARHLEEDLRAIQPLLAESWDIDQRSPDLSLVFRTDQPGFVADCRDEHVARFLVEAHAGWQQALKRAIAAEAKVRLLEADVMRGKK